MTPPPPRKVDPDQSVLVRVSVASMWQRFHGCEPDFIKDICHGRCCDAPSRPSGTLITIHPSEEAAIRARGAVVTSGRLESPDRVCPFKDANHLCSLHTTPDKPFGCIASPFTLNKADCLIVRNRYRMLPCYTSAPYWNKSRSTVKDRSEWPPAFEAFRASLDLIFGESRAAGLVNALRRNGDPHSDLFSGQAQMGWAMPTRSYEILRDNDESKKHAEA